MRLLAFLLLVEAPIAVLAWSALHFGDVGGEGGVLWGLALVASILALLVGAKQFERSLG